MSLNALNSFCLEWTYGTVWFGAGLSHISKTSRGSVSCPVIGSGCWVWSLPNNFFRYTLKQRGCFSSNESIRLFNGSLGTSLGHGVTEDLRRFDRFIVPFGEEKDDRPEYEIVRLS